MMKRRLERLAAFAFAIAFSIPASAAAEPAGGCGAVPEALVRELAAKATGLRADVLRLALASSRCAAAQGLIARDELLTVIDYSRPSTERRLWVIDLRSRRVRFQEHVAHGVGSGGNVPTKFSNTPSSRQTSLGLFVTQETYVGANGYSLRMHGLERGVNDNARARAIVMHGAPYVDPAMGRRQGRLGRSWGCPAVRTAVARTLIDTIKGGSPVFAYYPEPSWLASSRFLESGATALGG